MVITLCLISFNVYNSVNGPPARGCSYIELWMAGMEMPIILALLEYSMILGMGRLYGKTKKYMKIAKKLDGITCMISWIYFFLFCLIYWFHVTKQIEVNKQIWA